MDRRMWQNIFTNANIITLLSEPKATVTRYSLISVHCESASINTMKALTNSRVVLSYMSPGNWTDIANRLPLHLALLQDLQ